jgi:hypothetical protein
LCFCLYDRLATKNKLIRREILDGESVLCSGACGKEKILSHLFFDCDFFGAIWYEVASWLNFSLVPLREATAHVLQFGGSLYVAYGVRNVFYLLWRHFACLFGRNEIIVFLRVIRRCPMIN